MTTQQKADDQRLRQWHSDCNQSASALNLKHKPGKKNAQKLKKKQHEEDLVLKGSAAVQLCICRRLIHATRDQ